MALFSYFDEFFQFPNSHIWLPCLEFIFQLSYEILRIYSQVFLLYNCFDKFQQIRMSIEKVNEVSNDDRVEISIAFLRFIDVIRILRSSFFEFFLIFCFFRGLLLHGDLDLKNSAVFLFFELD